MPLSSALERFRLQFSILAVVGLLVNPTFLTWASSGLETALFNFCLLAWVFSILFVKPESKYRLLAITSTAALTYLARPDGILMVLGTLVLLGVELFRIIKQKQITLRWIAYASPICIPGLHFLWRHAYYGEWLPNTYYAKQVAAWPSAGIRYFASFVIEYGLWFWIIVVAVVFYKLFRTLAGGSERKASAARWPSIETSVVVACILGHVGYYTLIVGGDHFEWRVYSQLIPLIYLALLWAIPMLNFGAGKSLGIVAAAIVLSLPIPWTYHSAEKQITYVPLSSALKLTVSDKLPVFIAPLGGVQDNLQSWLTDHLICVRRQKHKLFFENQLRVYPERSFDVPAQCGKYPVGQFSTVGVVGWALPSVNILDGYGLNDYIIARTPVPVEKERKMAHDRLSPPHYFASFVPNVAVTGKKEMLYQARRPDLELTDEKIRMVEAYWVEKIVKGSNPPDSLAPWPIKLGSDTLINHQ